MIGARLEGSRRVSPESCKVRDRRAYPLQSQRPRSGRNRVGPKGKIAFLVFIVFILPSGVSAFCFEEAGRLYGISPLLLWSITAVESGFDPSALHWNEDGSYDYGLMQINSTWAEKIGLEPWLRLGDPCTNVKVGAWILAQCFERHGYTWEGVGCYNARSASKRVIYANRVYEKVKLAEKHR